MSTYFWTGEPIINLISAVAVDGSIGAEGKLLWKIPKDLEYYKARTLDNVIIMGEVTYETLPKVALRGRTTVVVSKKYCENPISPHDDPANELDVVFSTNPLHAVSLARNLAMKRKCDIYVAGGASIYEQLIEECEFAFITWVDRKYKPYADKFFPLHEFYHNFKLISESGWLGEHAKAYPAYKFTAYKNVNK
jgi:dihydrofolate reductase